MAMLNNQMILDFSMKITKKYVPRQMPLGPYDASPALWLASAIQGWPAQSPWDWPCMAAGMLRPRAPGRPRALKRSSAPTLGIPGGLLKYLELGDMRLGVQNSKINAFEF